MFTKPMLGASGAATLLLCNLCSPALSQAAPPQGNGVTALPEVDVVAPRRAQPPHRPHTHVVTARRRPTPAAPPQTQAQVLVGENERFDEARRAIVAPTGAGAYELSHQALEALPQGTNTPLDKVPDSAIKAVGAKGSESGKEFLDPAVDRTTGAGKKG